ncbi:MAG: CRISPR-associated RAMP protein Csx7 [Myxococcota bacterium]|nr:CRISPR-associated RAMP protein Csx7 [Myxococcota bacterium]
MHRVIFNRTRLDLTLEPETPWLVKSGDKGAALLRPELPDLRFMRTNLGGTETVLVPGSSLKGVVRSAAERVLRSVGLPCCDPLDHDGRCQKEASDKGDAIARNSATSRGEAHPMAAVHRMLCLGCRTFGSQAIASRVAFADALPASDRDRERANATEVRSGVSIDRRTGGPAKGRLFESEVVTGGRFAARIHMHNFELWQLALLGIVFQDMNDGFVRIGSAKSRGLGRVRVRWGRLQWEQVARGDGLEKVCGVGSLDAQVRNAYGLHETHGVTAPKPLRPAPLGRAFELKGEEVERFLDTLVDEAWASLVASASKRGGAVA